jgi:hypothetical protein
VGAYVATVATLGLVAFGALVSRDGGAYSEHLRVRLSREGASRVSSQNPPRGFEGWKGAPMWDEAEEIPVLFTKGAEDADFVVVGHSTDLGKDKYFLASLHKHGINAALSGNGTRWHWFEDKLMGAKAALLQMSGNPLVMFADTTDVMFNCPGGRDPRPFRAVGRGHPDRRRDPAVAGDRHLLRHETRARLHRGDERGFRQEETRPHRRRETRERRRGPHA